MKRKPENTMQGFTLIEMAVALTILGWVLGSTLSLVQQYADERSRIRERTMGNQVAWNQLMTSYRHAQGWLPANQGQDLELQGSERQAGQNWLWEMNIQPAAGLGLFRHQVDVQADELGRTSSLTMYLRNVEAPLGPL